MYKAESVLRTDLSNAVKDPDIVAKPLSNFNPDTMNNFASVDSEVWGLAVSYLALPCSSEMSGLLCQHPLSRSQQCLEWTGDL